MLSKFISVSETHFQNTETALKNQQASIQGLETQIGQLSKLISERPQGSLPSNTEPNPRERLNAISTQNKEGFVAPKPELQQDNAMNKGREEEFPRTKTAEVAHYYQVENKDIHEEQRLRIEELDEWREHKPITYDKLKLRKNKPDTSPNQLKVSDTVLLDAVDPYIVTTTPNEEIPLTVLSIFLFGMVEVSHPKFSTFKKFLIQVFPQRHGQSHRPSMSSSRGKKTTVPASKNRKGASSSAEAGRYIDWATVEQVQMADAIRSLLTTDSWELFFRIIEPTYLELRMELCSTFHLQTVMISMALYNPSRSKASVLPPSLRYLHAILAHTITGKRESTGVVNTHDVYFLWCMLQGHVIDLAYFIALAIQHQTERHRKRVIFISPYVIRLARHFGLLNTVAQESSFTLIGQMSPQGIEHA
ncbi:hypothetical protein GOBAR_AA23169 [Gossypium barbadense]|uniref:Uncharacterized protein n=1 Tax=Gossypium barbadense TaxID=3634 RepID=A0A2P5X2F1_GOSBA|nr:hypothetical protein GOBAR_AA23169 [Gossypium barbadense]